MTGCATFSRVQLLVKRDPLSTLTYGPRYQEGPLGGVARAKDVTPLLAPVIDDMCVHASAAHGVKIS